MKILIVDDCAQMRKAIRSMLEDLAGEIFEAADGRAAVEAYFLRKPDWVTLDIAMPVDGFTAVQEIKSKDPLARVLIVTAYDINAFRTAARLAGACGYILKDDLSQIRNFVTSSNGPQ